jgi:hypothetical protein
MRLAPADRGRITVVESIYHHFGTNPSTTIDSRFNRKVESDEQPYQRIMKIGGEWTDLDCGWLESASHVTLSNQGESVVEVSTCPWPPQGDWIIPPGESMRGTPRNVKSMKMRSRSGEVVKVRVVVFPV